jgi:bifunctional non-homologous end joining protein LigD
MATGRDSLAEYQRKRDFALTSEPRGALVTAGGTLSFVVQKHAARSLHYDFRLELGGTLKSWAVPKGPSLDPTVKRMAVQVEDHPLSYADFEGMIPPRQYGAGTVIVWDRGTWLPVGDAQRGLREGHLKFDLDGVKLRGRWALVRMKPQAVERQPVWLLMKERDAEARAAAELDLLAERPDSVMGLGPNPTAAKHARNGGLPATLAPQLATLVDHIPVGDDWQYEIKFDGYRLLTRVDEKSVRCFTRNGHDWSEKLPALVKSIRALKLSPCWLDGELVALNAAAVPDFQALQNAFDKGQTRELTYFVFDIPFHDGVDLRHEALSTRRELLQRLVSQAGPATGVRFSDAFAGDPASLLASAREAGLEGLIGKRAGSPYRSARSPDWVKLKTGRRQEFVIGGYTEPKGSRSGIGSLLLGVHDAHGALHYAGNVGSGFDERTLASIRVRLEALAANHSPFADAPAKVGARKDSTPHWVKPALLAEVSFAQWTNTGRVRHAVFHGLRNDKPARQIAREQPAREAASPRMKPTAATRRITHADRVVDTASGVTKGELVAHCERVAELMLPHLKARPVALVRAPQGVGGPQFFQKHADDDALAGIKQLDAALDPGHAPLLVVASAEGLVSAAQMNVVELHTWNMVARTMPRPDRMVFDLDPGEGVAWPAVREAAQLVCGFLDELGLKSLLKTSGGKGLHVVVPLAPRAAWQTVRAMSQAIVEHMASVLPQRFVAKSGPRNRVGKVYIDYLRNGWGATTAAAWSVRARPGLGVSVPIAWSELPQVASGAHWNLRTLSARLGIGNEPWAEAATRQTLTRAAKALSFKPPKGRDAIAAGSDQ